MVYVEVLWMPVKCAQCRIFWHGDKLCPMKKEVRKAWIPKKREMKNDEKGSNLLMEDKRKGKGKMEDDTEGKKIGDPSYNKENVGTSNMFNILESVVEKEEEITNMLEMVDVGEKEGVVELKTNQAASAGVVELMNAFKPKKKGGTKGRNKKVKVGNTTFRGQSSSLSL